MRPETSLERAVYLHRDWRAELQRECQRLRNRAPEGDAGAAQAFELARTLELAEPNRVHAVEIYLLGWRATRRELAPLERAYQLCLELGQLPTAAKIARLLYLETRRPADALREGIAWLDANQPDRAIRALVEARDAGEIASLALATARREWRDPRAEIHALRARARSTGGPLAAELLLAAARIARMLELDAPYGQLLREAVEADPDNDSAFSLLEWWLGERNERDPLMSVYLLRVNRAGSDALEVMRRAGTKWVLARSQVGLGVQLLTRCLEAGYASDAPIPGHLATLALLRRFAELAGAETELLNLIGRGLSRTHSPPEMAALAAVGLEIAWGRLRDPRLSHPLAMVLGEVTREHPTLVAYCDQGGMAKGQAMSHQRDAPVVFLDELSGPTSRPEPSGLLDIAEVEPASGRPDELVLDLEAPDADPDAGAVPAEVVVDYTYPPEAVPRIVERPVSDERRGGGRLKIPADIKILVAGKRLATMTRDVAERGLFFFSDEAIEVPCSISMTVSLPDLDSWNVEEFALDGRVVRAEDGGYAVDLLAPPDRYVERVRSLLEH